MSISLLKGIWNEKFGLKKTILFERTFAVLVHLTSVLRFEFVWYVINSTVCVTLHNDLWGIKYIFEVIPLNLSNVCWVNARWWIHTHTCTVLSDFVWQLQRYSLFPKKSLCMQCGVCSEVIYISPQYCFHSTLGCFYNSIKPILHYKIILYKWQSYRNIESFCRILDICKFLCDLPCDYFANYWSVARGDSSCNLN